MKSTHYPLIPIVPFSPKGVHTSSLVALSFVLHIPQKMSLNGVLVQSRVAWLVP